MKIFITLLLFCNFSFSQEEPIINNYGLSNTAIVDDIICSQNELQEIKSTPSPVQSTSIDYVDKYNRERNSQLTPIVSNSIKNRNKSI